MGAGVAGCAASIQLRKHGISVSLISRQIAIGDRLSEVLVADARDVLTQLGVWSEFLAINAPRVSGRFSCWGSRDLSLVEDIFDPHGEGWIIQRPVFDDFLVTEARRRNVLVWEHMKVAGIQRSGNSWTIALSGSGGKVTVSCEVLMLATGRSLLSSQELRLGRTHYDRLVAIGLRIARPRDWPERDYRPLIEAVDDGWWFSVQAADGNVDVLFFTDSHFARKIVNAYGSQLIALAAMIHKTRYTIERLGSPLRVISAPRVRSANSYIASPLVRKGVVVIGDAAMAVDPLAGQGVYLALTGAVDAADASAAGILQSEARGGDYAQQVRERFKALMADRTAIYSAESRWRERGFWRDRSNVTDRRLPISPLGAAASARGK